MTFEGDVLVKRTRITDVDRVIGSSGKIEIHGRRTWGGKPVRRLLLLICISLVPLLFYALVYILANNTDPAGPNSMRVVLGIGMLGIAVYVPIKLYEFIPFLLPSSAKSVTVYEEDVKKIKLNNYTESHFLQVWFARTDDERPSFLQLRSANESTTDKFKEFISGRAC